MDGDRLRNPLVYHHLILHTVGQQLEATKHLRLVPRLLHWWLEPLLSSLQSLSLVSSRDTLTQDQLP